MVKSAPAILRSYVMFRPLVFFAWIAAVMFVGALIPFVRYLVLMTIFGEDAGEHIQSLLLGVALLVGALLAFALGVIADLLRTNRTLIEEGLEQTKILRYGPPGQPIVGGR